MICWRPINIPTVTFLRRADSCLFDHVGIRNAEATALATNHLADLGHRHIAYLGGTDLTEVRQDRIAGYCDTLGLRGLGAGIVWDSEDNKVAGMNALLALYKAQPHITAVVCNGDMVALGACLALAQLGLVAGRDMSIIGFDDIEDAAVATPALSTMAVSPYQLGRKLARVMFRADNRPDNARRLCRGFGKINPAWDDWEGAYLMKNHADIIILGSGNAALCAGLAAIERGASVLILEKADKELAGGNSKYTAGAMRFSYNNKADLMPLLANPNDPRLEKNRFFHLYQNPIPNRFVKV